jgi:thiol-disulfide isomerase/thioredoxin
VIAMMLPIVAMGLLIANSEPSMPKIAENQTPSENFTQLKKDAIINTTPDKIYIYKYQYVNVSNGYLSIGNKVPNISFRVFSDINEVSPADDKKVYDLERYKGKKIVLNFWASWCAPCVNEFKVFQDFYNTDKDVVVFMVDIDNTDYASARSFANRNDYTVPIIYDAKELESKFSLFGIPRTVYIDEDGMVKGIKVGSFLDVNELHVFIYGAK